MKATNGIKRILSISIVFSMLLAISGVAPSVFAENETVIQLSDSASWAGDANKMDTIGSETTISGETGIVYSGLNITNELIEFNMVTNISSGWLGLKFRSDLPSNAPWDNKTGYLFLLQATGYQVMRQGTLEVLTQGNYLDGLTISDGSIHKITAGVVDSTDGNSVNVILKIDGKTTVSYSDTDKTKMTKGSSVFSVFQYGSTVTKITVFANENSTVGGIINRNAPATTAVLATDKNWFINNSVGMSAEGGDYTTITKSTQSLIVKGKGGATGNEYITATAYSFDVSVKRLEDTSGSSGINGNVIILFRKQNRNSPYGENAYGIRLSPSGNMSLVSYNNDKAKIFPAYQTNLDFNTPHHITIEVNGDISGDNWFSDIYIYVDDSTKAYKYRDNNYNPNLEPPAFFGVLNTDVNIETTISNISHNGTVDVFEGDDLLYPVYFADVMTDVNKSFLHWNWRPDVANYTKAIISTANGKIIGETEYPNDIFSLEGITQYDKLYISAVNSDGKRAEPIEVDLTKKASDLMTENVERIVIKTTSENAGFFTKDTNTPFIPNGVNYVGIRFGDHSTFEPEYGLIPAQYDENTVEAMMRTLKTNGYNMIRVFIIPGGRQAQNLGLGGTPLLTEGLYIPYMECFIDFVSRASKYGIYVMPTFGENEMVSNKFFTDLANNVSRQGLFFSKAGIKAKQQYLKWFLEYIKTRNPKLLDSVIALQMQNEFAFDSTVAPFNQLSGTFTFLDGSKYDMSNDDQRRSLANAAIKNYYKEMKKAIQLVDPEMLITEGTYSMLAVGKNYDTAKGIRTIAGITDTRVPMTAIELLQTDIDFLDMHVYRYGQTGTADEVFDKNFVNMQLDTTEAKTLMETKPVVMAEYGAFSSDYQEIDIESGMNFAKGLRDSAMEHGFAGAAYWTIDTFEQTNIWCLMWENGKYLPVLSLLKGNGTMSENWESTSYLSDTSNSTIFTAAAQFVKNTAIDITNSIKNNKTTLLPVMLILILILLVSSSIIVKKKRLLLKKG